MKTFEEYLIIMVTGFVQKSTHFLTSVSSAGNEKKRPILDCNADILVFNWHETFVSFDRYYSDKLSLS